MFTYAFVGGTTEWKVDGILFRSRRLDLEELAANEQRIHRAHHFAPPSLLL